MQSQLPSSLKFLPYIEHLPVLLPNLNIVATLVPILALIQSPNLFKRAGKAMMCAAAIKFSLQDVCSRLISFCNNNSLKEVVCIHAPLFKLGLQNHLYLNNNLLSVYGKCDGVECARQFFDEMPHKDVVSWTTILSAYIKNEMHLEALQLFHSMLLSGPRPNAFTFSRILASCSALWDFSHGKSIHASVIKYGLESNQILGSTLIGFYSKFDSIEEACKVFSFMNSGDTVSWTNLISSYVQAGKWIQSLRLYANMIEAAISPNEFTFTKLLVATAFLGLHYGKLVHAHMIVLGVKVNLAVKTALVDMYFRCHRTEDAITVAKMTAEYDLSLWTAIICGLAQNLKFEEAVAAFQVMEDSGISPNSFTYLGMLNASSSSLSLDLGRQIHSRVIMAGWEDDVPVGNALVDMYMKCSNTVEDGVRMFGGMKFPNVISWTSLISGFAEHGFQQESLSSYMEMRAAGVLPNSFTLSTILRACSAIKSLDQILKLHGHIIKTKAANEIVVNNALIDAYAGTGRIDDAWQVACNMSQRDAITHTCLSTRLNETGNHDMALNVLGHMLKDGVKNDKYSMACFLSASGGLKRVETGKKLHSYSVKSGLSISNSVLNGLVGFYGKCGLVYDAHRAFSEITEPDVVSWNGMISGLASNGLISSALAVFDDMRLAGVKPDSVTFLSVLFTCSRGGLVDMGVGYFKSMKEIHDIEPQLDHYICLVDLFGRAGRLEEAKEVLETMPYKPNAVIYKTLLVACKVHRNVLLGEDIARRGLELDPSDTAFYVLLANLYDTSGRFDLGAKTRRLMVEKG